MLKQDVPLRTGWFGYRKLDVENCIAHIRASVCGRTSALPGRRSRNGGDHGATQAGEQSSAAALCPAGGGRRAAASVRAEGSDKLQQLTRKLEAAHAEIRRYQTRLFGLRAPDDRSAAGKCRPRSGL